MEGVDSDLGKGNKIDPGIESSCEAVESDVEAHMPRFPFPIPLLFVYYLSFFLALIPPPFLFLWLAEYTRILERGIGVHRLFIPYIFILSESLEVYCLGGFCRYCFPFASLPFLLVFLELFSFTPHSGYGGLRKWHWVQGIYLFFLFLFFFPS